MDDDRKRLLSIRYKFWLRGYKTYISEHKRNTVPFEKGTIRILKIFNSLFGNVLIDIFVKTKYQDYYYWSVGGRSGYRKKRAPAVFYESRIRIEFNGHMYSVPKEYDKYLTYRFGDWKKTMKEWNAFRDDKAIVSK
jgi:hypothetical protein